MDMPANRRASLFLASVASVSEASDALRTGWVDILDAKDPRRGPLGRCAPEVLGAIAALRDRRARGPGARPVGISAALGDAADFAGRFVLPEEAAAFDYVKIGLRGAGGERAAGAFLEEIVGAVRSAAPTARVIAVAYADAP